MIGKLRGIIDSIGDDWLVLDVQGVGYQIFCPSQVLAKLPPAGEVTTLAIETYVREDQIKLFGFASDEQKEWFRLLMTVQGVGAKVALAVLGVLQPDELTSAILLKDITQISRVPGIGKKVAERICTELKGKVAQFSALADGNHQPIAVGEEGQNNISHTADAVSALVNLGYSQLQAGTAVTKIQRDLAQENLSTDKLIRLALKELSQ